MNLSIRICNVIKEVAKKRIPDKINTGQIKVLKAQNNSAKKNVPVSAIYREERNAKRYDFLERKGAAI